MLPQSEVIGETPVLLQVTDVNAPKPIIEDTATEVKSTLPEEEQKVKIPQSEPHHDAITVTEPVLREAPEIAEVQPAPKREPSPSPPQTVTDSQSGNTVYILGFGWLEAQGSGEVIYDKSIYENGNKIGTIG